MVDSDQSVSQKPENATVLHNFSLTLVATLLNPGMNRFSR